MDKLARRGWWKAMIHQGTLSLILTLDDFLISGPHLVTEYKEVSLTDPNIFFVDQLKEDLRNMDKIDLDDHFIVSTYYVLRPYIRGVLYGLNPLYQISLFVPCNDPIKIELYKRIISKIDIGGQFFQDRIYWSFEALENDIMDTKLACLIYAGNFGLSNDWLKKISIESKPFSATMDVDFTTSDNLFDLVEMRSFLEDVHQRYFSILNESKKFYFADIIRIHVDEKSRRGSENSDMTNTSGFYSATNGLTNHHFPKPFNSDKFSLQNKELKCKKEITVFKSSEKPYICSKHSNSNMLLEEYENIIKEQLKLNHEINHSNNVQISFAKTLCRWNKITQRKSDLLRLLLELSDSDHVHKRLKELNSIYCLKKCQSENDLIGSLHSAKSGNSEYLVISTLNGSDPNNNSIVQFTTWYTEDVKL